jgi:hypothetical protein
MISDDCTKSRKAFDYQEEKSEIKQGDKEIYGVFTKSSRTQDIW